MKKTNMKICVAKKNGYDVYRTVYKADGHYYIKWNKTVINVDDDIKERNFTYFS